jgi:hypothetical protein
VQGRICAGRINVIELKIQLHLLSLTEITKRGGKNHLVKSFLLFMEIEITNKSAIMN